MTTAETVLDIARREIGTRENPPGSNDVKYTRWYPMVGQPWCDMFVSWVLDQAGMAPTEGKHAYTPAHFDAFKARGRAHYGPNGIQPGDIVFYDFPGGPDRISHVGIAETTWNGQWVDVIEGNTDAAGGRTGGQVIRHRRTSSIVGYGRPEFTTQPTGGFGTMDDTSILTEFANTTKRTGAQLDAAVVELKDQAKRHNAAARERDAKLLAVLERIATKLGA